MNLSKFKIKKNCTVYHVTDSYYFNDKHNADSYLNSIAQILVSCCLSDGLRLSGYIVNDKCFIATYLSMNPSGYDIDCEIDFSRTTLTITVKE